METLYRKVGRRYVPVSITWDYNKDFLKVGTFRMKYAYGDGGGMYEYDVTPDTAGFVAASMIARKAMEQAMQDAAIMKPSERGTRPYTKRELALIEQFRKDMGGMMPTWWEGNTNFKIAEAGIKAIRDFRP